MPFRQAFDCLWCGRAWQPRDQGDLTGWAMLCAECVDRAQDNGFLRYRVRAALRERSGGGPSTSGGGPAASGGGRGLALAMTMPEPGVVSTPQLASVSQASPAVPPPPAVPTRTSEGIGSDDWYLRRGTFARGPALDLAWHAELDQVTAWLDAQPLSGSIVELVAGSGWWSPLLAGAGELSVYDMSPEALDRARERLVAHRLRAHLHVRDAWAEPDRQVDGVVITTALWRLSDAAADDALAVAARWLRPGGRLLLIEPRPDPQSGPVEAPSAMSAAGDPAVPDRDVGWLEAALARAGLRADGVQATSRFFLLGAAIRPG